MTAGLNQICDRAEEYDQPGGAEAGGLPPMTPEAARRLAATLAPHLLAMRAVLAGTSYAASAGVSPATKIFIAGVLERIPA